MEGITYNMGIINKLNSINNIGQGIVGEDPDSWSKRMGLNHPFELSKNKLERNDLKKICANSKNPNMFCYLNIMAWGGQGNGPGGKKNVKIPWNEFYNKIDNKIEKLREGNLNREDSFNLFCGNEKIKGLGPSYFSKLLYFFDYSNKNKMYIMDQWTTKPILLLTNLNIIKHNDFGPSYNNNGKNYDIFCRIIDDLVHYLNLKNGYEVEEKLFSIGSINRKPRGEFRQYVVDNWEEMKPKERYNHKLVDNIIFKLKKN